MSIKCLFFSLMLAVPSLALAEQNISVVVPIYGYEDYKGIQGTISLTEQKDKPGLVIEAKVNGLPEGKHGFHIHEIPNCRSNDGSSAGGHYNPTGAKHGGPQDPKQHLGDLGNLVADKMGHAYMSTYFPELSFASMHAIGGRSFVIHANEDDFSSQPSGNSGARAACAVIPLVMKLTNN